MAEVVLCALLIYALRICNVLVAVWMPLAGVVAGGCNPFTASAAAAARMR
jgi:hypothetical protein